MSQNASSFLVQSFLLCLKVICHLKWLCLENSKAMSLKIGMSHFELWICCIKWRMEFSVMFLAMALLLKSIIQLHFPRSISMLTTF